MRTQLSKIVLAATFGLALALTFSCSSDDGGGGNSAQLSSSSNSWLQGNSSSLASSSSYVRGSSSSSVAVPSSSSTPSSSSSSSSSNDGICSGDSGINGERDKGNDIANYRTTQIGDQVWMAENLNYNVSGSKCGGNDCKLYDENTINCDKYGRLYDWATAMALPSKCNSTRSTSDADCAIKTPNHQGICPSGWHIPSNTEWDALYRSADGTSGTGSPYTSPTAEMHLKAREDWTDCGPSGSGKTYSCEDTYNFSALPGGFGLSIGSFGSAGDNGYWWSASEYSRSNAYRWRMCYNSGYYINDNGKDVLHSVRCLQD